MFYIMVLENEILVFNKILGIGLMEKSFILLLFFFFDGCYLFLDNVCIFLFFCTLIFMFLLNKRKFI